MRSGRRVAFATVFGAVLIAASAGSQAVFVDVKAGDDGNFGEKPGTPVQTISRALDVASRNLTISWTIWVAGRVDEEGAVLAYDDDPDTCPPSRECFPLPMLRGVSLVWDEANSDVVPIGPDFEEFAVVRPVVRSGLGLAMLVGFSPPPGAAAVCSPVLEPFDPAGRRVTLSGLGFEGGNPAISIPDSPYGAVSVLLRDLEVRGSLPCVEARASRFELELELRSCLFELLPPVPRVTEPDQSLLVVRIGGEGMARATIEDCMFRAEPAMGIEGMARFDAEGGRPMQVEVRDCRLEWVATGGAPGARKR